MRAGAVKGEREDAGAQEDGEDLVEFGADEDEVLGEIVPERAGNDGRAARFHGVEHHEEPARRRHDPLSEDEARIEPQRPDRDEDEDVREGRDLEIEGRGFAVGEVEGPDHAVEEHHVGEHRGDQQPARKVAAVGRDETQERERAVGGEDHRHGLEDRVHRVAGARRERVERGEDGGDGELDPADQPLGALFLCDDELADAGGHPCHLPLADAEVAEEARRQCGVSGHGPYPLETVVRTIADLPPQIAIALATPRARVAAPQALAGRGSSLRAAAQLRARRPMATTRAPALRRCEPG